MKHTFLRKPKKICIRIEGNISKNKDFIVIVGKYELLSNWIQRTLLYVPMLAETSYYYQTTPKANSFIVSLPGNDLVMVQDWGSLVPRS